MQTTKGRNQSTALQTALATHCSLTLYCTWAGCCSPRGTSHRSHRWNGLRWTSHIFQFLSLEMRQCALFTTVLMKHFLCSSWTTEMTLASSSVFSPIQKLCCETLPSRPGGCFTKTKKLGAAADSVPVQQCHSCPAAAEATCSLEGNKLQGVIRHTKLCQPT